MKLITTLIGAGLALSMAGASHGQDLYTGSNVEEILNAARGLGSASLTEQSNGDPQITGKMDGITYQVYFRNCTNNEDCEDINFYLGFLDIKPGLEKINDWNFNKRFSRAYLDQDEDACVEMDLDLVKGVSPEYLDAQFAVWSMIVEQFPVHVGFK